MPTFSAAGSTIEIVATKAARQIFSRAGKFIYFGGLGGQSTRLDSMMAELAIATHRRHVDGQTGS